MRQGRTDHQPRGLQARSACKWVREWAVVRLVSAGAKLGWCRQSSRSWRPKQAVREDAESSRPARLGEERMLCAAQCGRRGVGGWKGEGDLTPGRLRRQHRRGRQAHRQDRCSELPQPTVVLAAARQLACACDAFERHAYIVPHLCPPRPPAEEATGGLSPAPSSGSPRP